MSDSNIFEKERKINQIISLLQTNEEWWLDKLAKKLGLNKSNLQKYLELYNIVNKKQYGHKKILFLKDKAFEIQKNITNRAEAIRYAINLRKKGYSYSKITEIVLKKYKVQLESAVLSHYLKNIIISKTGQIRLRNKISNDRRKACKLSIESQRKSGIIGKAAIKNIKLAIERNTKKLPKASNTFTTEKARLIGHCFFDGCVINSKKYKVVSYCSNTKSQVESFCKLMQSVYNFETKIEFRSNKIYIVRFCSKELVKDLLRYSPSYSTSPNSLARIPKEILNGNKDIKRDFLKAFWDDEGAILFYNVPGKKYPLHQKQKLEAFCANNVVLNELLQLHKDLGIDAKIKRNRIDITTKKNLEKFEKEVGFSDYTTVTSRYSIWYGIPKNLVLKYTIQYYKHKPKAFIKTYGCTGNQSDSKNIAGYLMKMGILLTTSEETSDIIIINSCGVITPTEEKTMNYIRKLSKNKKVIVAGCLVNILPSIKEKAPNINCYFGANQMHLIVPAIISSYFPECKLKQKKHIKPKCKLYITKEKIMKIRISTGCLGNCSYCCTKFAQGILKSKPVNDIVKEVSNAINNNCNKIYLTSPDTGCYGFDIKTNIVKLLNQILEIDGDFKVRIGMANPNHIYKLLPDLVEIYKHPKMLKFLHIPVQSGSDKILKSMNRLYTIKEFKEIVKTFRKEIPNLSISTDIIVGFPGETENDFQNTVSLLEWLKPEVLNFTKYWPRKDTIAGDKYLTMIKNPNNPKAKLDSKIKQERAVIIHNLFEKQKSNR